MEESGSYIFCVINVIEKRRNLIIDIWVRLVFCWLMFVYDVNLVFILRVLIGYCGGLCKYIYGFKF